MAWAKLDTNTLSATSTSVSTTTYTTKKFQQILFHSLGFTSNATDNGGIQFNGDTNSVYATRRQVDGGTDATITSDSNLNSHDQGTTGKFQVNYVSNISGEEKLTIGFVIFPTATGAGTAPRRHEQVGKYVPSPDADITSNSHISESAQEYPIGTNLTTLGGDETETVTLQNGTIFEETDTNKAYIWNSSTKTWTQLW